MNILTFTSLFPNAARPDFGIFVYQRTAALSRSRGDAMQVVAPVPYFPSWAPIKRWHIWSQVPERETVDRLSVFHPRYPLLPGIMPLHGLLMFWGCLRLARRLHDQFKFDCIDAHYIFPDAFAAVLLGRILKIPVFVTARGTDINVFPRFRSIRPLIRWTLTNAAGIVAVSMALKEAMIRIGIDADKIKVIANGVDPNRFYPIDRDAARSELDIQGESQVIVSVGALVPAKSQALLISAVAELKENRKGVLLYLIGDGPMRSALSEQIERLQLKDNVFIMGNRRNENLRLWFSAADISCLCSLREGMPNVVLESLACGTPVVATRVGGVPEVLASPELGVLVEPSVEDLCAGLTEALKKPWDRGRIAEHGRSRSWETVAAEVKEYFVSALSTLA